MSGYIGNIPTPQATQTRDTFTATSGQTSFATSGYTPDFLDVFLNGVHLVNGTDYTASNGSDVVLTSGATTGDNLEVVSYSTYEVNAQTYTGGLTAKNDGAAAITANRLTSDGTILDLKKDGSTVGSIGSVSGDTYIGTGDVGLRFDDGNNILRPVNSSGADVDGSINLGGPSQRFLSAYLSGGVYLGGTGSANRLDDYEEGTWSPHLYDNGVKVSDQTNQGTYVKVGDLVHVTARIFGGSAFTSSVHPYIILPFAPASGNTTMASATLAYATGFGGANNVYILDGSSQIRLSTNIGSSLAGAVTSGASFGGSSKRGYFSLTYKI